MYNIVPLALLYKTHTFGPQAVQACSDQSIVIVNPNENKVYKHPLMYGTRDALELICGQPARNVVFPVIKESRKLVFMYFNPLYKLLKTTREIKLNIVPFVGGVVAALLELHQKGRAHLDIRRENICYDNHDQVKLIDLDRNCSISKEPLHLSFKYGVGVIIPALLGLRQ